MAVSVRMERRATIQTKKKRKEKNKIVSEHEILKTEVILSSICCGDSIESMGYSKNSL